MRPACDISYAIITLFLSTLFSHILHFSVPHDVSILVLFFCFKNHQFRRKR
uniref:Secreted protein n=1 Tax=Ascaris lumbricoides TaxID=6252 RepID=A0A0M3IA87_ASCLU